MHFLHYKIIGAPKKLKHQPRPLVRSSSLKFGQHFWNLSHETVPLKWTWRQKFTYMMLTLLSKGIPPKLLKFFRLKIFSFATGVSTTPVVNLELRISPFRNNSKRSYWDTLGQKQKISWHCPFKCMLSMYWKSFRACWACAHKHYAHYDYAVKVILAKNTSKAGAK